MFPPVEAADEHGFLCWGGDLAPRTLKIAYHSGIFPWPHEGMPLLWFSPPQRAILRFDQLHIGTRLKRELRKNPFEIKINTAFEAVMRGCAQPRGEDEGTWITRPMQRAFGRLHQLGHAHSVEAWRNGELAGGLYGVSWGAYFGGESMFFRESNASKAALIFLVEHLQKRGARWLDCQMMTPHFAALGATEIERAEFMVLLRLALAEPVSLFD